MNTKILEQLEFTKTKQLFAEFLQTQQAYEELIGLTPFTDIKKINHYFEEVRDMELFYQEFPSFEVGKLNSISEAVRRLELEADLSLTEWIDLKKILLVSAKVQSIYAQLENVKIPTLGRLFETIETFPSLQGALQSISDNGYIENFASPELERIRRKISSNESMVRNILLDILKSKADYLTDTIIASRNDRSVLPVKNSYRNKFAGVVHDISSSGNTVYIEPRSVVNLNEEITQLKADERFEISRILNELSQIARPHALQLRNNAWLLGHIDFVRAKFLVMRQYQANLPLLNQEKNIQLLNVRHPLLENPVANDLYFRKELDVIVITGPNTGGKTIMLKTLGLTQLMAQSGLPIFADKGSQVAIFSGIFADIGDEQSIEQSLSTFSSHMTHIVSILKEADKDSLILFDELGAGTDPQEGASLAMSILDHLRLSQIKTMATTHYPELKAYGIETKGVENASMEFDTTTLSPTYRFMQGVPGRSNAFEIARRLGLAPIIVKGAEAMVGQDNDVNLIIEKLEHQTLESRKRLDHIKEVEQENLKFNRAVKKLYNEFSHARDKELEKASQEAQLIIEAALEESNTILNNLHHKSSQLKPHEVIEAKAQLKNLAPKVDLSKNKVLKKAKKQATPKVGDNIIVTSYGQHGTLTKLVKDKVWEAQVGLIKMTLREDEFSLVKSNEEKNKVKKKQVNVVKKKSIGSGPRAKLDLRGKRYEEAMEALDNFIDQALLNNLSQVDIIHGIGTGVIRDGVTKYLRRNRHVKSFAYAPQNAGGSGATIVNLG